MNRFAKLVGALKQRPITDKLKKTLDALDEVEVAADDSAGHQFYLPYSSEPKAIEERWR